VIAQKATDASLDDSVDIRDGLVVGLYRVSLLREKQLFLEE